MDTIPQSPEKASPPVCKKCGAEIPPGKLACDCFLVNADREIKQRALDAFKNEKAALYLCTGRGHHILPVSQHSLSLCGKYRAKNKPDSTALWTNISDLDQLLPTACPRCADIVKDLLR